jgi:hypothetical protein
LGGYGQLKGVQRGHFSGKRVWVPFFFSYRDGTRTIFSIAAPFLFDLGREARPGKQTGIHLYQPVPAEEQNESWGHRLTSMQLHIRGDIKISKEHLPVLDLLVFLYIVQLQ